jgi:hypothetical protein
MSLSIPPHLLEEKTGLLRAQLRNAAAASMPPPFEIPNLSAYPVSITYTKTRGLHLIANRDIAVGEILIREAPPAAIIRPEWLSEARYCGGCFNSISSERAAEWAAKDPRFNDSTDELCEDCANSSRVRMLDRRIFWRDLEPDSDEEDVSDVLSTLKVSKESDGKTVIGPETKKNKRGMLDPEDIDDSLFRFFQRVVFNWDAQLLWKYPTTTTDGGSETSEMPIVTSSQHIFLLTSPTTEHVSIEPQITAFVSLLDTHLHVVGLDSQKQQLEQLIRIAFHNAHEIADTAAGRSVGMGIYPISSLLNHACSSAANADWAIEAGGKDGGLFVAKARKAVKEGEELRIEYGKFGDNEGVKMPVKQEYIMKTWVVL